MKTKYLIVGNSTAAINAAEAIREEDKKGRIMLVSDEQYHTYSRPLITYYLGNKVEEDNILYRPLSFYDDLNIRTFFGRTVIRLDPDKKQVTLDDQTKLQFEKLLLATGGTPFLPLIPGRELHGVFTFTTLEDAYRVKKFINDHQVKKAVVIGGGLIGLKLTDALLALNIQVTIVELADRILSATFDKKASGIIEKALNMIGCSMMTGNTVEKIIADREGRVESVILKDNTRIDCNLVFMAIGVLPRIDLLKGTGIKFNRGILVNEYLQTSIPDIYAAGDVVETYDLLANAYRPLAILPNASLQGKIAGFNMAGIRKNYPGGLAMNSIELAGIPTISVGLTDPSILTDDTRKRGIEVLQEYQEENFVYKKVVLEKNKIIGAIFINKIDRAGIYTGLIKDKVDITPFKDYLLRDDFGLLSLPKEYRKHMVTSQGIEV